MAATEEARAGLVLPEYGPTGPELVRRRFGPRTRRVLAVAPRRGRSPRGADRDAGGDGLEQLEHRSAPVFTLLYPPGQVHRVAPRPGELVRLRSHRGRLLAVVTVRRLTLPPYRGSVSGLLPVYAERHLRSLAAELPGFRARTEGKARVNDAPGYQLRYRSGPADRRTLGTDILVVPEDGRRDGVVLRYRQTNPPRALDDADRELVKATRKAFRSFRFGLDRP